MITVVEAQKATELLEPRFFLGIHDSDNLATTGWRCVGIQQVTPANK